MPATRQNNPAPVPVAATLSVVGYDLRPDELTQILGLEPSATDATSFPARFTETKIVQERACGLWSYDTGGRVRSRDIGEHLRHLLGVFRPLKSRLEEIRPPVRIFVHLRSPSVSPVQALAPCLEAEWIAGLAELGAALTVELVK